MKRLIRYLSVLTMLASTFCHTQALAMAKGADVSWISEMEDNGYVFYNDQGVEQDLFQILKDHGMDSIRLRVWVNPADGWYSSIDDVINKALRAQAAGMRIMIDFHYSDSWADPGQQTKPAAWSDYDIDGLMSAVWWHTYDSLTALKNAGVTPEWVQVGNETNNGMLWDEGMASANMQNFAWLINSGRNAAKEVFPNTLVVVHLANCQDNDNFRWIFDGIGSYGANYDVIGASIYPTNVTNSDWATANANCLANLNDMLSRYNKDVIISEIGAPWDNADAKAIVSDMVSKVEQVTDGRGLGIFYWEPQASNFNGYTLGAWNPNTGRPTDALDAFIETTSIAIQSRNSGKCIDVYNGGTSNGNDVIQSDCASTARQQWHFSAISDGYYQIQNSNSGLCLDVSGKSTADGANILQWSCKSSTNQQFLKEDMGEGYYRLKSRLSGKCIDVYAAGTSDGDTLVQWTCHENWNQQWADN